MAKDKAGPGISARLDSMLAAIKPADLSERQWCIQSQVNTSFFTDLRNGREPGIDKIERLAKRAGLTLADFLEGLSPIEDDVFNERLLAPAVWEIVQNGRDASSASDLRPLVSALSRYLRQVARRPAIHDNPDALEAVAHAIIPPNEGPRNQA